MNLHGIPRVTEDLDLLIALDERNVNKFAKAMKGLGYKPKVPVTIEDFGIKKNRESWIKEKGMVVFSLWNTKIPYRIIDVFVKNPIDFEELYKDRLTIPLGEFNISVISINHLIKLKKIASRKQDISDIESLKRIKKLRMGNYD